MAVHFDGTAANFLQSTADAPELLQNAAWTIGVWVRVTGASTGNYQPILGLNKSSNQGVAGDLVLEWDNVDGNFELVPYYTDSTYHLFHSTNYGVDNTWRILFIYNNIGTTPGNTEYYIAGENGTSSYMGGYTNPADLLTTGSYNGPWWLGGADNHPTVQFEGDLSQFFIVAQSLTGAEQNQLAGGALITDLGYTPINWYKLASDTDTTDYGSAGNDLVITGSPTTATDPSVLASSGTTIIVSDSASGLESLNIGVGVSLSDSASAVDAFSGSAQAQVLDTGTGADSISASALVQMADAGSGQDAISAAVQAFVSDAAVGRDAIPAISVALALSDSATGTDSISLNGSVLKAVADAASASDAVNVETSLRVVDNAAGQESLLITALLSVQDSASAIDLASVLKSYLVQVADAATGTESLTVRAAVRVNDSGQGLDTTAIQALLVLADSGVGIDTITVANSTARITTITFTFSRASVQYALSQPEATFTLSQPSATSKLN